MKISLYLPKETKNIRGFLETELSSARNIKSKQTKNSVIAGLQAMIRATAQGI